MITVNNNNKTSSSPTFGYGAVNGVLNYLATNQAIGASAVDITFMIIPRTAIDFTRTPEAGIETGRRESASGLLYAGMGFMGLGAAHIVGLFSDSKKYGIPLHKINAGSSTIDAMAHFWNESLDINGRDLLDKKATVKGYLNNVFDSVSGLSGETKTPLTSSKSEIVDELSQHILEGKEYSIPKDKKEQLVQKIIHSTGAGEHLTLKNSAEEIKLSAGDLLDNAYSLGRTFMQDNVADEFKKFPDLGNNEFVKSLKRFNSHKMILGVGIASSLAFVMQAINRYMTKKKTGANGFVVYKDDNGKSEKSQKDTSTAFRTLKGFSAAAMGWFTLSQIGGKLKDLPKKLEFTKLMPNMNQYKYVYGLTIIGRLLASSDKNELRETATRDFLGFASWLVLGDVAAKLVARALDPKLLNCADTEAKGFGKLMKSSIVTHAELLYRDKRAIGKSIKEASKIASPKTKISLRHINIAQLSGYAYSGLLLGIFIPVLNKMVTNKLHEKEVQKKKIAVA